MPSYGINTVLGRKLRWMDHGKTRVQDSKRVSFMFFYSIYMLNIFRETRLEEGEFGLKAGGRNTKPHYAILIVKMEMICKF